MADPAPPADDGALEALLRERRFGPPDHDDATPWDFVRRWPAEIARERAWPVISRLLTDADELVRARAVELARVWSEGTELTKARILEVAEQRPELYGDQAPEGVSLRNELAFALSNGVDEHNGARVAAVLRDLAEYEPIGGGAASVLGRYHPEFVAVQARQWGEAQLGWILEAARSLALFRRDSILQFLGACSSLGEAARAKILATVEDYVKWDDATAIALAQGQRLPPPKKPAPSADECKRAIGL